jgi:NADPH:quinone reductase-like Zn-dependent oxidoreductase
MALGLAAWRYRIIDWGLVETPATGCLLLREVPPTDIPSRCRDDRDVAPETVSSDAMRAVRLLEPSDTSGVVVEEIDQPVAAPGEALIRVRAAAITRGELDWPVDRLPAIPSYELSGVVDAVGSDVEGLTPGDEVFALTPFDRDGVAAEYAAVRADVLAPKPHTTDHVESAAIPMGALTAWQGLFIHGELGADQRVLILGAAGGVGHLAVQLARSRGAHVIGSASSSGTDIVRRSGADEVIDQSAGRFDDAFQPVDLVFDTAGGEPLRRAPAFLRPGGKIVTIAEAPPDGVEANYFVVDSDRDQLAEISALVDRGELRPMIDRVYELEDARSAFERSMTGRKRGKVVIHVGGE